MSPLAEETRVGKSHYTWAHRNEVVPDSAPAAMGADYEDGGIPEMVIIDFSGIFITALVNSHGHSSGSVSVWSRREESNAPSAAYNAAILTLNYGRLMLERFLLREGKGGYSDSISEWRLRNQR